MRNALLLATALAVLTGAHLSGERADAEKNAHRDPDELMYLPEGRMLRAASLGNTNLMADLIWLRSIQYYGEQRMTTRNYDQAERLFQVIYDLDPRFMGATRFGALVLSQDAGNPDGAVALLDRAAQDDPDRWEYPFDAGFIHQTVRRDYEAAGNAYRTAASLPGAPQLAHRLAGISFAKLGDRDAAREVWSSLLEDDNAATRSLAVRSLRNLDLDDGEERLTKAVFAYREARGQLPPDWGVLLQEGFLESMPEEPWGGQYFWVPENDEVLASTTIDRRMGRERDAYRDLIEVYREKFGTYPTHLDDINAADLAPFPVWKPFGITLDWNPVTGHLAWNPPWPATEPRYQGEGENL
jgi:tetratricopeptide (TPR) repeat protein